MMINHKSCPSKRHVITQLRFPDAPLMWGMHIFNLERLGIGFRHCTSRSCDLCMNNV